MILIDGLEPEWTHTDENIARLVDREDYWLNSEYASWTTDPDDPEVKAAREHRKESGAKPPSHPILYPVALRPPAIHNHLAQQVADQLAQAYPTAQPQPRKTTIASARDMLGLWGGGNVQLTKE